MKRAPTHSSVRLTIPQARKLKRLRAALCSPVNGVGVQAQAIVIGCYWAALIFDQGPENIHYRTFLVKKPDYVIEDTWHAMGLQATGSNDIIIKEPVFVPEYRTHHQMDGFNCKHYQDNEMYSIPWAQMFVRVVCTPAIGAAKHALQLFIDNAQGSSTDVTRLSQ